MAHLGGGGGEGIAEHEIQCRKRVQSSKKTECSNLKWYLCHNWDTAKVTELLFNFASQQAESRKAVQPLVPQD